MPRRRLTNDERELWHRVAKTARRLVPMPAPDAPKTGGGPVPDPEAAPPLATPQTKQRPIARAPGIGPHPGLHPKPQRLPATSVSLAPPVGERLAQEPVRMDRNLHRTMMRGKLEPEARIDLHGMTVTEAHQALMGFMLGAHARGLRLVLVITGKGRKKAPDVAAPMPARAGILKHEVPMWLRAAPLGGLVLELRESHRSHGGSGAYYVYLRKRR
jgi:DNA-nicking Smr family endonuclease